MKVSSRRVRIVVLTTGLLWLTAAYLCVDMWSGDGASVGVVAVIVGSMVVLTEGVELNLRTSLDAQGIHRRSFARTVDVPWSDVERWYERIDGWVFVDVRGPRRRRLQIVHWGPGELTSYARNHLPASAIQVEAS